MSAVPVLTVMELLLLLKDISAVIEWRFLQYQNALSKYYDVPMLYPGSEMAVLIVFFG